MAYHIADKHEEINIRLKRPKDYTCKCKYCKNFLGELYATQHDNYYSNAMRKRYYAKTEKHIAAGQVVGYRYAIQQFTKPGDWIFDPTVGTGTAVVEAINNNRNGIGIELEFPEIAQANVLHQRVIKYKGLIIPGDARGIRKLIKRPVDLVINGTPYPKLSALSSDAPQRTFAMSNTDPRSKTFNYKVDSNFGLSKGEEWVRLIGEMYSDSYNLLKPGGKMIILIKDLNKNKKIYNLHGEIADVIQSYCPGIEYYGTYIHRHLPSTMHMHTYEKRFPGCIVPKHQVGVIFRKPGI